jgi:hypothetical protein
MKLYPLKTCHICGTPYPRGTRKPKQYLASRYCSRKCSGLAQRNSIAEVISRLIPDAKTGCLVWTGHALANGYGHVAIARKMWIVHRLVWEFQKGQVPKGKQLDHLCGNKRCANVEHLRICTARENMLADTCNNMGHRNASKTCCPKCGGPYSVLPTGNRYCPPCRHSRMMDYQRQRRREMREAKAQILKETI